MAQTRKRRAASAPPAEPPAKRRYSTRLSDKQKGHLRKAVLYLAPRYDNRLTYLEMFDEARVLLSLNHLNVVLRGVFSRWFKDNKDGEWKRMKEQAERDGHEVYFADLIELDSANAQGGRAQLDHCPPRTTDRGLNPCLTNDERLAIAKAVLYLAPRTVGAGRRFKNTDEWRLSAAKIYPVVKELLGLEHKPRSLLFAFQRWLKENKAEWEEMKAESERDADYFDELIEHEEELIRQGSLEDTRPVPSESGEEYGVDEAQEHLSQYIGPPSSPSRLVEPPHCEDVKQEEEDDKEDEKEEEEGDEEEEGEDDSESDSSTLYYDVIRPLPTFDENGWTYDDHEPQDENKKKEEEKDGEEACNATGGATSEPVVVIAYHHHHHEHHYHYPVTNYNYFASGEHRGVNFSPPPPQ